MRRVVLFASALTLALSCSDSSEDCGYYKDAGYCETYKDTLKEMCEKTCGFCSGGGGGGDPGTAVDPRPDREPDRPDLCRDTCSTKDCQWYKSQGHCEQYSAVMMMNCAATCNWCGARLCAPPDVENGWTDFEMTMIPSGANINVYCYDGFKNMGSTQLTCNSYGEMDGQARCEASDSGPESLVTETACLRAAKAAMEPTYVNGQFVVPQASTHYVPQCDDYNGNFKEIQYDGAKGETFCCDMYRGNEVQGTRIQGKHEYISCVEGSAKEYYERLAQENAYNSASSSSSYDYNDYNSGSSSNYNDYNSGSSSDYNDYNSGSSSDYYYEETSSDAGNAGYDAGSAGYDAGSAGNDAGSAGYVEEYYNYDLVPGDYGTDDGYYAEESDGYYVESGEGYEVAGGEDYYNYDTSAGGGYYAEGGDGYYSGDGFDDTYYYSEGDEKAEEEGGAEVLYSATEEEGSVGEMVVERVAAVERGAEESAAAAVESEDVMYRRWRSKRDAAAELDSVEELDSADE